jgi:hypothetical protein
VSQSGSQAAAFFREVARNRQVWYLRDDRGSPAPKTDSGQRVFPYWSSHARAQRAASIWGGGLRASSACLEEWRSGALPELAEDGYLIGINWTGPRLVGWEFTVAEVLNRLDHVLREGPYAETALPPPQPNGLTVGACLVGLEHPGPVDNVGSEHGCHFL